MPKLAFAFVLMFFIVVVSEANHRRPGSDDDIAQWALDEIGSGFVLIKVRRTKLKHIDGTLYNMRLKVREVRVGGRRNKTFTCRVKVAVFDNRRALLSHTCYSSGRRPFGSVGTADLN